MFGKSWDWWTGKNSIWGKIGGSTYIQSKSTDWWTGENSWIGNLLGQSVYGKGNSGGGTGEAEVLKYAMIGLAGYVIVKSVK